MNDRGSCSHTDGTIDSAREDKRKVSNVNLAGVMEFPGSTQFWVVLNLSAEGSALASYPTKAEAQNIAKMINMAICDVVVAERERCATVADRLAELFNSNVSGRPGSMDVADHGWAKRRDGAQAVADDIRRLIK